MRSTFFAFFVVFICSQASLREVPAARPDEPVRTGGNQHAEEERRDHECLKNNRQIRINAAAAPDATKVNALAWTVPAAPVPMEIGTEKSLTQILCLGQSL